MKLEELREKTQEIEAILGYTFRKKEWLEMAFTHRSYVNENRQALQHNERLEFLGDSVLGLLIADFLFHLMPDTPEGDLSTLRSRLVEASSCMRYVNFLNLAPYILLGKGERMNDGRGRESIISDLLEAIIGAIYLDGGLQAVRIFLFGKLIGEFEAILKTPVQNWKAALQDYCQKKHQQTPEYLLISETGPDHNKFFEIAVTILGQEIGRGSGSSKKEAQQASAKAALESLGQLKSTS